MKLSLRNKFLLPTVAVIVLSLGAATTVSYINAFDAMEETTEKQLVRLTSWTGDLVSSWIEDRKVDVSSWSGRRVFLPTKASGKTDSPAAEELVKLAGQYHYYESLNLVDAKADVYASSASGVAGKVNLTDRAYFHKAMGGQLVVSDVIKSRVTGNPVFTIAAPMMQNGTVKGVLVGVVKLDTLTDKFIINQKFGKTGYAYMTDQNGIVIAHPDKSLILELDLKTLDFGRKMLAQKNGFIQYDWKGENKIVSFKTLPGAGWLIGVAAVTKELVAPARRLGFINLIIALIGVTAGGLIVFFIAQSVTGPIKQVIEGLDNGADHVSSAAVQMAETSQSLAQGSSEQASSLEESAASLEEVASMTRQNAESANKADTLMKGAQAVVEEANHHVAELTGSMEDIKRASEQTSNIIGTIDQIAFQTNLLALNAAVEAARAGEAGAGFAVVADEVRSLAMRAAEAAQNTSELIETTVKKVHDGSSIVISTADAFAKVADSAGKVGELVDEIAAASQEQNNGIDQVSMAVNEIGKLTQQNAASAEESASASEQMRGQADHMKNYVADLVGMVEGSLKGKKSLNPTRQAEAADSSPRLAIADDGHQSRDDDFFQS